MVMCERRAGRAIVSSFACVDLESPEGMRLEMEKKTEDDSQNIISPINS